MELNDMRYAVRIAASLRLSSPLLLRSGATGVFADSLIERTPDNDLHINGYVWAGLIRRALQRIEGQEALASQIGFFPEGSPDTSALWSEDFTSPLLRTDIRPGISVDRHWGVNHQGGLYSDELVPAGLPLKMEATWFAPDKETADQIQEAVRQAFWVIHQEVETIGGGWSYGLGRLQLRGLTMDVLDLSLAKQRRALWSFPEPVAVEAWTLASWQPEKINTPWTRLHVTASIPSGQFLAVASKLPPLDPQTALGDIKLPDTFIFRGTSFDEKGQSLEQAIIPGRSLRQALFAVPIERKLRTVEKNICETPTTECTCRRCLWFGAPDRRGIIAVTDAVIPETDMKNIIINRVQLCEHSMHNVRLFSGEYLSEAAFSLDILIDHRDQERKGGELLREVRQVLTEMQGGNTAPEGWHRVGFTSTCTGALRTASEPEQTNFGKPTIEGVRDEIE